MVTHSGSISGQTTPDQQMHWERYSHYINYVFNNNTETDRTYIQVCFVEQAGLCRYNHVVYIRTIYICFVSVGMMSLPILVVRRHVGM